MTSPGERWRTGKGSRWAGWRRNWSDTGLRACLKNIPVGLAAGRGGWVCWSSVTDFSRICSLLAPRHPPRRARNPFPSLFSKHALSRERFGSGTCRPRDIWKEILRKRFSGTCRLLIEKRWGGCLGLCLRQTRARVLPAEKRRRKAEGGKQKTEDGRRKTGNRRPGTEGMRQGIHLPPAMVVEASTRAMGREKRRAVKRQRRD